MAFLGTAKVIIRLIKKPLKEASIAKRLVVKGAELDIDI